MGVVISRDSYRGKPTVQLCWDDDDRYPFSFGLGKAKMLISALNQDPDFLKRFVEDCKRDRS